MLKTLYFSGLLFAVRYCMRLFFFYQNRRFRGLGEWVGGKSVCATIGSDLCPTR